MLPSQCFSYRVCPALVAIDLCPSRSLLSVIPYLNQNHMNKAGHTKERPGLIVSDFDFIRIHAAARKSKQRHGCFLSSLPYLPRPPAGPFPGRGCHRLRPALPHHSPARAVASPELTNTEGTPPKSLTGREKVSLYPVSVIASGLPQPDQWIA